MSNNRECTKAMAAIEARFCGNQKRTAVITQDEFRDISNYIETLEHDLMMTTAIYNDYIGDETICIPDQYEQARQANKMRWYHLNDSREFAKKLVMR